MDEAVAAAPTKDFDAAWGRRLRDSGGFHQTGIQQSGRSRQHRSVKASGPVLFAVT
jgi:hypothetical protein